MWGLCMKYSVVIPLYNKEHYIAGTLRSVIVVDDGSTDHSLQACKEVRSDKIRVVQQVNQGVSAARNKGIEMAAGEYICFLDADDTWHPDYLQNIETIVQKYPQSDIFVTAYRIIYANGVLIPYTFIDLVYREDFPLIVQNATGGWLPDKLLGNTGQGL